MTGHVEVPKAPNALICDLRTGTNFYTNSRPLVELLKARGGPSGGGGGANSGRFGARWVFLRPLIHEKPCIVVESLAKSTRGGCCALRGNTIRCKMITDRLILFRSALDNYRCRSVTDCRLSGFSRTTLSRRVLTS